MHFYVFRSHLTHETKNIRAAHYPCRQMSRCSPSFPRLSRSHLTPQLSPDTINFVSGLKKNKKNPSYSCSTAYSVFVHSLVQKQIMYYVQFNVNISLFYGDFTELGVFN